jgi:hypothetical protein
VEEKIDGANDRPYNAAPTLPNFQLTMNEMLKEQRKEK